MTGATTGGVRVLLRLEGLFILVVAILAYGKTGMGWGVFALFFLAPDLSFLGYLAGPRVGAIAYNMAHSYIGPVLCVMLAFHSPSQVLMATAFIWFAHIGFDRALGYGLKYAEGFAFTHLGVIGRARGRAKQERSQQAAARESA